MSGDRQLADALDLFLRLSRETLADGLLSVMLHGSVVFDDLAPGYGDLDFVAIVVDDLTDAQRAALIGARVELKAQAPEPFGTMIEGAFLPRRMLDPSLAGCALWWGTSGDRAWHRNKLGWFVLGGLRRHGRLIWGTDLRAEIPVARQEDLVAELGESCRTARQHARGGTLHSVDWLLMAARALYWLRERELCSKSHAAAWATTHAEGHWRESLTQAARLRQTPHLADSPAMKRWLDDLAPTIQEAFSEVERELAIAQR